MFSKNMGNFDRAARVVVGLALLIAFFAMPGLGLRWVLLIGIVPLVTGLFGTCPAYSIFGISTSKTQ